MAYRHDYFKKQIDQMARVLAALLTDILGLKNEGRIQEMEAHINSTFIKDLGFDFDEVMATPANDLVRFLVEKKMFSDVHLNHIANILFEVGVEQSQKEKPKYYTRALAVFEYLQTVSDTYSFDFMLKINRMKEELNENEK